MFYPLYVKLKMMGLQYYKEIAGGFMIVSVICKLIAAAFLLKLAILCNTSFSNSRYIES
jgi:hypothetical protein